MAKRYAATGAQNVANPADTAITISGAATTRGCIYFFVLSCAATPADNAIEWIVQRRLTVGTATALLEVPLDGADAAALCLADENHTVEPTYEADKEVFDDAINQRMTFQWSANPDSELVIAATASTGFGWQPVHSSFTGLVEVTVHWYE